MLERKEGWMDDGWVEEREEGYDRKEGKEEMEENGRNGRKG